MITIVTDTSAGYTREEAENKNVRLISLAYFISGKAFGEMPYGENEDYAEKMRGKEVTTSAPSAFAYSKLFEELTQGGGEVLCITLSSKLSPSYKNAVKAAEQSGGAVMVVDSGTVSGGLRLMVNAASEMIFGGASLREAADKLEAIKNKIGVNFTVQAYDRLKKRGLLILSKEAAGAYGARPVFTVSGGVGVLCSVRGIKARINALIQSVPQNATEIIVLFSSDADSQKPCQALKSRFPHVKIEAYNVGPAVEACVGEGALGVAYKS